MTNKNMKRRTLVSSISALTAILIFTVSINVSETLAQSLSEIPVLKEIANVLTFRDYSYETENVEAEVTIPKIVDLRDSNLEDKINKLIEEKVNNVLAEAEIGAAKYKEAFIETGGIKEEYAKRKVQVDVDYEIKSSNNTVLTLGDLLGSDYISVISKSVKEAVELQK